MPVEDSKRDQLLRRIQIRLAILGSVVALIVGGYNLKKILFEKPEPEPPPPPAAKSDKIRAALEDVGASWIETLKKKND